MSTSHLRQRSLPTPTPMPPSPMPSTSTTRTRAEIAARRREDDFFEKMTPRNKVLTQLYVVGILFSGLAIVFVLWSWGRIKTEALFSEAAKGHLLGPYGMGGYGGMMLTLLLTIALSIAQLSNIINTEQPFPELYSAAIGGGLSISIFILALFTYSKTVDPPKDHTGKQYNICRAPGADLWKQLPCSEVSKELFYIQVAGLVLVGIAAVVYFALCILHIAEVRKNTAGKSFLEQRNGYKRLDGGAELDPYQIPDSDDEDEFLNN